MHFFTCQLFHFINQRKDFFSAKPIIPFETFKFVYQPLPITLLIKASESRRSFVSGIMYAESVKTHPYFRAAEKCRWSLHMVPNPFPHPCFHPLVPVFHFQCRKCHQILVMHHERNGFRPTSHSGYFVTIANVLEPDFWAETERECRHQQQQWWPFSQFHLKSVFCRLVVSFLFGRTAISSQSMHHYSIQPFFQLLSHFSLKLSLQLQLTIIVPESSVFIHSADYHIWISPYLDIALNSCQVNS